MSEYASMNLFQKMLAIASELPVLKKTTTVKDASGKEYKSLPERAVLDAVKPLEMKYGVFSYPASANKSERLLEREYVYEGQPRKSHRMLVSLDVTFRFVNVDKPTETIEIPSFGMGLDGGDKAPGKAMTYAMKYALMKAYKLTSEDSIDDPDMVNTESLDGFQYIPMDVIVEEQAQNQADQPTAQNPATSPAAVPFGQVPMEAFTQPEEPKRMSFEDAQKVVVNIGQFKGKTLGEVMALRFDMIRYYADDTRFKGTRYPELKEACKVIVENIDK